MLRKLMVGRMIIALCLLPLAEKAYGQRGVRLPVQRPAGQGPRPPVQQPAGRQGPKPPIQRPAGRQGGLPVHLPVKRAGPQRTGMPPAPPPRPAPPMNLSPPPPEPPLVVVAVPIVLPPPPPPKNWREATDQVAASPLGNMASAIGSSLAKGWAFLKDHAPDMAGAMSHLGQMAANGAAMLPSIADVTASVSQAAKSVAGFVSSALPSLSTLTDAAGAISRIIAVIAAVIDKAKWLLITVVALVAMLLLWRIIRLGLTVAQIIRAVVGFLGILIGRRQRQPAFAKAPDTITIHCPGCPTSGTIPARFAGQRLQCKKCQKLFTA
jgi:hypothetical protein